MEIKYVGKISGGQDGAIWKNELFRFRANGACEVFDLRELTPEEPKELQPIARFTLDRAETIVPHSNAVCFGSEFFSPEDEYPLLYSNIYNNYANAEDQLMGVCCVYRLQKTGGEFKSTLVQLIQIGFCEDSIHWKAFEDKHGYRPYGNFVVDRDTSSYYAFVMRSKADGAAYFRFDLPSVRDGEIDSVYGVKKVVLNFEDAREFYHCPYHRFPQGAIAYGGRIYSTEGFSNDEKNHPAIRLISLEKQEQELYVDIMELGYTVEPEMIDFYMDECYYSDVHGNLYIIDFDV